MYDIVIGRSEADKEKYSTTGAIFLGKHYVKMGQTTSLSNKVYLDVAKSHVVFVVGKRGSGKSYSMGVIAEGIYDLPDEIKNNIVQDEYDAAHDQRLLVSVHAGEVSADRQREEVREIDKEKEPDDPQQAVTES